MGVTLGAGVAAVMLVTGCPTDVDAAGWSDWAVGGGTLALAAVTAWMASETRSVATETRSELDVTRDALNAAQRQIQEATRARIDARSPQVVIALRPQSWQPYDQLPGTMVPDGSGGESLVAPLPVGHQFTLPQDENLRLYFLSNLYVRNDGRATAIVDLSKSEHEDRVYLISGGELVGGYGGGPSAARYALAPGEKAEAQAMTSTTVARLVSAWGHWSGGPPEARMTVNLVVTDQFDDGIIDRAGVEVIAYPLMPLEGDDGAWVVRDRTDRFSDQAEVITGSVARTKRTYVRELPPS